MNIEHMQRKEGTDWETDRPFYYNIKDSLSTSYKDDKFSIRGEHSSQMQGTVRTSITLSVEEARKLKKELEIFLSHN